DARHHVEVAGELRLPGHVAYTAVAVLGEDGELLNLVLLEGAVPRRHSQLDHLRGVGCRGRRAGSDPLAEELIFVAFRVHALAAAVRHLARRLAQDQALIRSRREHTPAARLLGDGVVVETGVEAKERQLEAVLTTGLPVTAAGVAAQPAEQRHDL